MRCRRIVASVNVTSTRLEIGAFERFHFDVAACEQCLLVAGDIHSSSADGHLVSGLVFDGRLIYVDWRRGERRREQIILRATKFNRRSRRLRFEYLMLQCATLSQNFHVFQLAAAQEVLESRSRCIENHIQTFEGGIDYRVTWVVQQVQAKFHNFDCLCDDNVIAIGQPQHHGQQKSKQSKSADDVIRNVLLHQSVCGSRVKSNRKIVGSLIERGDRGRFVPRQVVSACLAMTSGRRECSTSCIALAAAHRRFTAHSVLTASPMNAWQTQNFNFIFAPNR